MKRSYTRVAAPRQSAPAVPSTTLASRRPLLQRARNQDQAPHAGGGRAASWGRRQTGPDEATVQAGPAVTPPILHEALRSPGRPLDGTTRAFMESRFGHDFGHVRVHTDARAAVSAGAVDALAYTVGRDVVFGAGQYQPGTAAGWPSTWRVVWMG
jgi:hypothetical protein